MLIRNVEHYMLIYQHEAMGADHGHLESIFSRQSARQFPKVACDLARGCRHQTTDQASTRSSWGHTSIHTAVASFVRG